jgi:integrase/recombinase XerD
MANRIPEFLEKNEVGRLMRELEPTDGLGKLRNLAIIRVLINTGLRARELRELTVDQINWQTGRFKVRGKGNRERVLWMKDADLLLLQDWLSARPQTGSAWLFTTLDGRRPLCDRWLRKMVKTVAKRAGIKKDVHPHIFRHTFSTNLLQSTKNLFLVQQALGHKNISTTTIYLHLVNDELERALKGMGNGQAI